MKTGCTVADAMTTKPITVPSNTTVKDAARVIKEHNIGSLLVVDDGILVGIVTSEDFVNRVCAEAKSAEKTLIVAIMTKSIVDIAPEADVYDAMLLMKEHDILHLPVRDETKRLLGFLTLKDVLRIEPQLFELVSEMAEITTNKKPRPVKEGYCQECGNYSEELVKRENRLLCQYCGEEQ